MRRRRSRVVPAAFVLGGLFALLPPAGRAQAPGVRIARDRGEPIQRMVRAANVLREEGRLLSRETVAEQLGRRAPEVVLPEPNTTPLSERDVWQLSRDAHVRVGWHYLCTRCDHWHQSLAGGFVISADGLVATCHHVIDPEGRDQREGYLVAASEDGAFYPVVEVLGSDARTDVAIIRVDMDPPAAVLPLNVHTYPGDRVWCYSAPLRRTGFFSEGIINRFYYHRRENADVPRMEVSTDWAPGSSGSAVVDRFGNAVGVVSSISAAGTGRQQIRTVRRGEEDELRYVSDPTVIVFRSAALVADIRALIGPGDEDAREAAGAEDGEEDAEDAAD